MAQVVERDGGGGAREIKMNSGDIHEIMRYISTVELSFQTVIAPKVQALSQTKYYEGGEAAQAMAYYADMLNKVNEIGDLYVRANSEVWQVMTQMIEQDQVLAQAFYDSLEPGGQLYDNLSAMFPSD